MIQPNDASTAESEMESDIEESQAGESQLDGTDRTLSVEGVESNEAITVAVHARIGFVHVRRGRRQGTAA